MNASFPNLTESFKGRFPFRLSVPSFVYPADYATNTRLLGPYVDEIELLIFESRTESLPSAAEIAELADLQQRLKITFNVHLPLDIDLSVAEPARCAHLVARLVQIVSIVRPLCPTTYTLHLIGCGKKGASGDHIERWQARTRRNLTDFLSLSDLPPEKVSIETLDYPPQWFAPLVNDMNLAVCLDVGHVLRYGFDLQAALDLFPETISIVHLHGVAAHGDHLALDHLADEPRRILQPWLMRFSGSVSLELFSFEALRRSLPEFADMMSGKPSGNPSS